MNRLIAVLTVVLATMDMAIAESPNTIQVPTVENGKMVHITTGAIPSSATEPPNLRFLWAGAMIGGEPNSEPVVTPVLFATKEECVTSTREMAAIVQKTT